jgi:hypothetical protein
MKYFDLPGQKVLYDSSLRQATAPFIILEHAIAFDVQSHPVPQWSHYRNRLLKAMNDHPPSI